MYGCTHTNIKLQAQPIVVPCLMTQLPIPNEIEFAVIVGIVPVNISPDCQRSDIFREKSFNIF